LSKAFKLIDLDGSGSLTRGELIRGCREKEPVRELLSLPRNLRGDAEATAKFEAVFAHLDPDGSGKIDSREFIGYFTSAAGRAAVAALGTAPSWHKAVADLSFSPDLPPAQRAQNGFKLWASEARFEHGSDEWAEEREESARTLATDLAQWEVAQLDGISREQLDHLLTSKRTNLEKNSAFPMGEVMTERRRVEATLEQRMAHLYKQPSADVLRKLPVTLSKPGGAASSLPSEPKTAGASSGGRRPAEPEVFDEDTDEDVP